MVEADAILLEVTGACREAFGERLLAAYALGSLAHSGFSPLVSDIDLGLILSDPLENGDQAAVQAIVDAERRKGSPLRERLSVFWGSPKTLAGASRGGRFGALDRLDLLDSGRLLAGTDARHGIPRPSTAELIVEGAEFAIGYLSGVRDHPQAGPGLGSMRPAAGDAVDEIRSPELLMSRGVRRLTKLVLFPVRFLYTAETGRMGTNHEAATHYVASPAAPGRRLVEAAIAWRDAAPDDGAQAVRLLREGMLPLYLHYIDDHLKRLAALGEAGLAGEFTTWRRRLVAWPTVASEAGSDNTKAGL